MSRISTEPLDNTNTDVYVSAFVDELQRCGLPSVVIFPGSRSTPLAMTFAAQSGIHLWMHIDERSAAFFGLGMAKRLGHLLLYYVPQGRQQQILCQRSLKPN